MARERRAETASARQGRNQVAFRHPCHRATEDGVLGTQKIPPPLPSLSSCLCGASCLHQPYAASSP